MEKLPDTVTHLYHLKTLKISNNSLSDINPKVALIDSLVRISIEGNPLKSFKPAMRQANAKELKEFLQMKLKDEEIRAFDQKQAVALHVPGATNQKEVDRWETYLREFVVNKVALDLKGKGLDNISPRLWNDYG